MNNIINKLNYLEKLVSENLNYSKSFNTLRAYRSDFRDFEIFCLKYQLPFLPTNPKAISLYLSNLSLNSKFSTLKRRLASISVVHKLKGHHLDCKHPLIMENLNGIKRKIGVKQLGKKPLLYNNLINIIDYIDHKIVNKNILLTRDKSLLLIGFAGGFRRSELSNLKEHNLEFVADGVKISVEKSKNDQFGEGLVKAIPYFKNEKYCPVIALKHWIKIRTKIKKNLFECSDKTISLIVKKYVSLIGLNHQLYSGHSLRSGFATSTASFGADERSIMIMTGHKSTEMVRRYIRDANLFQNNALNTINK